MAGLFEPGLETTTTTPGAPSNASAALKLFIIQLLMQQLQKTGGAPQTFGNYISEGPRRMDTSQIAAGMPGLMQTLQQPGAFNRGPTVEKKQPASPSLFQDLAPLLGLGLAGYQAYKGPQVTSQDKANEAMADYFKSLIAAKVGPTAGGQFGFTADPSYSPVTSDLFTNSIGGGSGVYDPYPMSTQDWGGWESSY